MSFLCQCWQRASESSSFILTLLSFYCCLKSRQLPQARGGKKEGHSGSDRSKHQMYKHWKFVLQYFLPHDVVASRRFLNLIALAFHPVNQVPNPFNRFEKCIVEIIFMSDYCVLFTCPLFLVILKNSSIRVCLLHPAALSFSRSSRVFRKFSIRLRTRSTLKTLIRFIQVS